MTQKRRLRHKSTSFVFRREVVERHLDWLMGQEKGGVAIEAISGDDFWTLRFKNATLAGKAHRRLLRDTWEPPEVGS
jgi:hypothetical protein